MEDLKIARNIIGGITLVARLVFSILAYCELLEYPTNLVMGTLLITFTVADFALKIYELIYKNNIKW